MDDGQVQEPERKRREKPRGLVSTLRGAQGGAGYGGLRKAGVSGGRGRGVFREVIMS